MKNYYQILEVDSSATLEDIKRQFHFLAQTWHPDKHRDDEHKMRAEQRFFEIKEAYDVLSDPDKRADYDYLFSASVITVGDDSKADSAGIDVEILSIIVEIANNSLVRLIQDLIRQSVRSPFRQQLERYVIEFSQSYLSEKLDELPSLRSRVISEIDVLLSNNNLRRFIERLEFLNPIDESYDWSLELDEAVAMRRAQLGLPKVAPTEHVQPQEMPIGRIRWTQIEQDQASRSHWAQELEEMQERIRQRRLRKDTADD